jgi:hypothetical protein
MPRGIPTALDDIFTRLLICEPSALETGCWEWPSDLLRDDGYARVSIYGTQHLVHRFMYEHFVGPVPEGSELDHLCRNRACANFEHLEAVPHKVNMLRGAGVGSANAAKTHCLRGHDLSPRPNGRRQCLICKKDQNREASRRHRQKMKQATV